jgi:hypothetical protein
VAALPTSREDLCRDLAALSREPGYIYAYCWLIRRDLYLDPTEAADVNWRERLSFQELTFLGGLMVKAPLLLDVPDEPTVASQIERTDALFAALHGAYGEEMMGRLAEKLASGQPPSGDAAQAAVDLFGGGVAMAEAIFYSGSGAYDFQYWTFAPARYESDAPWLLEHVGFDIATTARMVRVLRTRPDKFREGSPETFVETSELLLDAFCIPDDALEEFDSGTAAAFLSAFSLEPGSVNADLSAPGQYNALLSHPIVRLDDGRRFLPVPFNLAQSLYESPTHWMRADPDYRDTAAAHRGDGTEEIVAGLLGEVFGSENVYRGIEFFDGRRVIGEIDVLAVLGRKAIVVQCKSKSLTMLARSGDRASLEADFRHAVQDAYDQGISCRRLMLEATGGLHAKIDGGTLSLPPLDDVWIMCVLSDHYPALTHQTSTYLSVPEGEPQAIALSLFDLDVMGFYLQDPFEFMYYVRQRVDLATYYRADEELTLLACHLKTKLVRTPGIDAETIDGTVAQLIDANFPVAKGHYEYSPAAERLFPEWKNPDFDQLLADIRDAGDPGFVDAAFLLFDLSRNAADQLTEGIRATRSRTEADGKLHTFVTIGDGFGISFAAARRDVEDQALAFGEARKYRAKTDQWLALGGKQGSTRLVDFAAYSREPWREDPEQERLARALLKAGTQIRPGGKVGRNERCPCGSGRKYKHCHGA